MRIAKHMVTQHSRVLMNLSGGIQPTPGVVQVNLMLGVEPAVLRGAQIVERAGGRVVRVTG